MIPKLNSTVDKSNSFNFAATCNWITSSAKTKKWRCRQRYVLWNTMQAFNDIFDLFKDGFCGKQLRNPSHDWPCAGSFINRGSPFINKAVEYIVLQELEIFLGCTSELTAPKLINVHRDIKLQV